MPDIQTDVSDNALVTAVRANLCDFFRYLGRNNPAGYFENETFSRWQSSVPHPWFNGVLASKFPTPKDDAFIKETIQYFLQRKTSVFTWWLAPHLDSADWEDMLIKHGFGFSDDTPGMAVDLQTLNESIQKVDGFEIRVVQDDASLRTWAQVFTSGYGLPKDWESIVVESWGKMGFDLPIRNYIGYLNNQPVATSCLFLGGGAAGIYSVSTLPDVRGKGIGAAITLLPLQEAREMGYRIGVLQSSDMGINVYKRLGFKHVCQLEHFYLSIK
jgi:ribosomal protein S18 acetylase RimI-like enzyme